MGELRNLVQLLWRSRLGQPGKVYLSDTTAQIHYDEFWNQVQRLADWMVCHAVPGERLMIVSENSPGYVRAYFAALYARQTVVEVNPNESLQTLGEVAAETSAWSIYADAPDLAKRLGLPALDVTATSSAGKELTVPDQARQTDPNDPACIVYTSGTTGRPKGVMLSHGNLLAVTEAIIPALRVSAEEQCLLNLPLYHTYGKSVLHTATSIGSSLHFAVPFNRVAEFVAALSREEITIFNAVPFHIITLARWAHLENFDLSRLRKVTVSGAPLQPAAIREFKALVPHVEFYSMYGLTESSTRACILPPEDTERKAGSVGLPIRGVSIEIRDDAGAAVSRGTEGNIWLSGPNIMLGYFKAPELTAEALKDGWLWTGDVGRLDEDGYLYITDRKKDIIKCAGERISPREIEFVLENHPNIAEAAVVGMPDLILGESPCAFVVERHAARDQAGLNQWCLNRLSRHKLPRAYRFVDSLPRTGSGKIRKSALISSSGW